MGIVTGTAAADTIIGSIDGDLLYGLAGADTISGGTGDDSIDGGADNDTLLGQNGDDTLFGGLGLDSIDGGEGKDELHGGDGNDVLTDDSGSGDALYGEDGNDNIVIWRQSTFAANLIADGGIGDDRIWFAIRTASSIAVSAGAGNDVVEIDSLFGSATIALGAGQDTIRLLETAAYYQPASLVVSDFQTGVGGDRLDWNDFLNARLSGWDGSANPFGAAGFARLVQSGTATVLEIDANGGGNGFVAFITFSNTTVASFNAYNLGGYPADGTAAGQVLNGTSAAETLDGGVGADIINALGGADQIRGGAGNDVADGGADNDQLYGENGNDTLSGGIADDMLDGGDGNDELHGGEGQDLLTDDSGSTDKLYGEGGNDNLSLSRYASNGTGLVADGGAGDDRIWIAIRMQASAVAVAGGAGADLIQIDSLFGTATVSLGDGQDTIRLDETAAYYQPVSLTVSDFQTGAAGDKLAWNDFLAARLVGWNGNSNPFAAGGWLRLEQAGADVRLQIDANGGGDAYVTFLTFQNTTVAGFTQFNLGGYPADGSVPGLTLTGTAGAETLTGGIGGDAINGLGGWDQLYGGGGADNMDGGADNDFLYGESGNDVLHGGLGFDSLEGGDGNDILHGGADNDALTDDSGATDQLYGEDGNDNLVIWRQSTFATGLVADGGAGDDKIWFAIRTQSTIAVSAGTGNDQIEIDSLFGSATVSLGAGQDVIRLFSSTATYQPASLVVTDFQTGNGGDRIDWTNFLNAKLSNWNGSANPFGTHMWLLQSGADTILQIDSNGAAAGGLTNFITFQNTAMGAFTEYNLGGYPSDGSPPGQILAGTPNVDSLNGGGGGDIIYGLASDDQISGGGGDDIIDGGLGGDSMNGGSGDDLYIVDSSADLVIEAAGGGFDEVQTAIGSRVDYAQLYHLPAHVEKLTATSAGAQGVWANGADNVVTMGNLGDLVVLADSADYTSAAAGNDNVSGGGGNDFLFFGGSMNNADRVDGGAGFDTLGLLGNYSLVFDATDVVSVDKIGVYSSGNAAAPYTYSLAMHDANLAAGGTMMIVGLSLLSSEALVFNGSAELDGSFTILAGRGGDILTGGGKNDYVSGGEGADALYGLAGSDTLLGGLGADTLNGGAGLDYYVYQNVAESTAAATDHITNFKANGEAERIDLKAIDANSVLAGNQAFTFIGTNAAFTNQAGQLRVADIGGNWFVQGDVNGDGAADLVIQIDNGAALTFLAGDFIL